MFSINSVKFVHLGSTDQIRLPHVESRKNNYNSFYNQKETIHSIYVEGRKSKVKKMKSQPGIKKGE